MKPAILVLTSTYPRWANDPDPGFVHELCRRLAPDYEVHVLAPHCRGAQRRETMDAVHVHRFRYFLTSGQQLAYDGGMLTKLQLRPWLALLLPLFFCAQLFSAWRLSRRYRVALVHAHWVIPQGLVAWLLGLLRPAPLVVTSHGADVYGLRGGVASYLKGRVYTAASAVTVVSRAMAEAVGAQVAADKLQVAPMGVDLQQRFVASAPLAGREGLVFVGRLVEKKGVDVLLRAYAHLARQRALPGLSIVGDGPLRPELEGMARDLGLAQSVTFAGAVPNAQLPQLLNRHAIAVVPSVVAASGDQEGLGLVTVEAMGCGCAVIASDLPAIRDVVRDGRNGLLFAPADAGALAVAIERLIDDDALRCELARQGGEGARRDFDWSGAARRYRELFATLL